MSEKPPLLERARIAMSVFRKGYPWERKQRRGSGFSLLWPSWREGQPQWHIVDLDAYIREGFEINSLIYSAIMYKARSAAMPRLRAWTGDPAHPEALPPNHQLSKLVARPNQDMSQREYQSLQTVYFNATGNAYGVCVRPRAGGLPEKIVPLNPLRVHIVPGPGGSIKGYLYVPEGASLLDGIPVLPQDMMHAKLPNPSDPLEGNGYGLSPMSPLARSGDVDNMVTSFLKLFFERGAMVTGVLNFDTPLDPDDIAEIKGRWAEMYGGFENWQEIGVLDQGGKYERMSLTFEEMGFTDIDERNEARILGPFGVPLTLLPTRSGQSASTLNNKQEDRRMFWEDTMTWEIGLFEDDYAYYLQSEDGGFVAFDFSQVPALRQDVPKLVTAWKELVQFGVPKSKAAELVGLDLGELPDGDVVYMPVSMVPVNGTPPAEPTGGDGGGPDAEDDSRSNGKALPQAKGWSPEQKAAHYKAIDRIAVSWERRFAMAAGSAFEHDKRELLVLLSELKSQTLRKKQTIAWQDYLLRAGAYLTMAGRENWRSTFIPLMQGVVTDQVERWSNELGLAFDVENLFARDWFNQYTLEFAQEVSNTTKEAIAQMVAQAQAEGWTIPNMQSNLETLFRQYMAGDLSSDDFAWFEARMPAHRRELIARDQTLRSSNAGVYEQLKEWRVSRKEWLGTPDERIRDSHADAWSRYQEGGDPGPIPMNEPFILDDGSMMMFPGDPGMGAALEQIIQCRCTMIPVVEV